ncbi:MAG: hypothetical protein Q4A15_08560, partial [Prevotellaceae bacterium]|nr:hypothetical protein [Prevotellaceae bacterium]
GNQGTDTPATPAEKMVSFVPGNGINITEEEVDGERVVKIESSATIDWNTLGNEEKQRVYDYIAAKQLHYFTTEDGFFVTDEEHFVSFKVTPEGIDAAKLSEHFKELIRQIEGLGVTLGETDSTAFSGLRGVQLERAINNLQTIVNGISSGNKYISSIAEDTFVIADEDGNVGMKYDEGGLDVARLSTHLKSLIKQIDGLGLALGEGSAEAYPGNKGKLNAQNIETIKSSVETINNTTRQLSNSLSSLMTSISKFEAALGKVDEDGFHVADENGNVGMKYDVNGFDAAKVSEHFKSLLGGIGGGSAGTVQSILGEVEVLEDGIFFVDSDLNIGSKHDATGFHSINLLEYKTINE